MKIINWDSVYIYPSPPLLITFSNADSQKVEIIKEIKGKAGIYRWINNKTGKCYVGSAVDLTKRIYKYYSLAHIMVQSKHSIICKSLIKYDYGSFSFEILEYCNKKEVLIREQYYLDLLKPEYNILKRAGSILGYLHTEEAKEKMRGPKNHNSEHLIKIKEHIAKLNSKHSIIVEVFDTEKGTKNEYSSIRLTGRELNCSATTVKNYLNSDKLLLNRYIISTKKKKG